MALTRKSSLRPHHYMIHPVNGMEGGTHLEVSLTGDPLKATGTDMKQGRFKMM